MSSDLHDLVSFLGDKKPEVRKMAADIVSGLTGSPEGVDNLKHVQGPLVTALLRLVPDSDPDISRTALTALVNLSQDAAVGQLLLQMNVVNRVLEYVREKSCPHIELLLMLLVNMTSSDQGCQDLLQLGKPGMEGLNMALLLKMFVTSAITLQPGQPDPMQHIGSLLTNATRLQEGRQMLLQPGRGFLQALVAQLSPGCSVVRRHGCAGALKNCCISAEGDSTLTDILADAAVLSRMLTPLGGDPSNHSSSLTNDSSGTNVSGSHQPGCGTAAPSPPAAAAAAVNGASAGPIQTPALSNKSSSSATTTTTTTTTTTSSSSSTTRDPDDSVREALAEAIAALAGSELGLKALWAVSAPERLKLAYEDEHNPEVSKAMEQAARCFMFGSSAGEAAALEDDGLPQTAEAESVD